MFHEYDLAKRAAQFANAVAVFVIACCCGAAFGVYVIGLMMLTR